MDRAGLVGADGATHCGFADVAYMGCLPNMVVMAVGFYIYKFRYIMYQQGFLAPQYGRHGGGVSVM